VVLQETTSKAKPWQRRQFLGISIGASIGGFLANSSFLEFFTPVKPYTWTYNTYKMREQLRQWCREHAQAIQHGDKDAALKVEQQIIYRPEWANSYSQKRVDRFIKDHNLELPTICLSDQHGYNHSIDTPKDRFVSANEISIYTLYKPPAKSDAPVIIFVGGQGTSLDLALKFFEKSGLTQSQIGYLAFEYPGFGHTPGYPSEQAFYGALEAVTQYLNQNKISSKQIYLVGPSLGGAVTTELATKHTYGGIILISTFISAARIFQDFRDKGWVDNDYFPSFNNVIQRYETLRKIPIVKCPIIIGHGAADDFISPIHGETIEKEAEKNGKLRLFKLFPGVKHEVKGLLGISGEMFQHSVETFGWQKFIKNGKS